MGVHDKILSTSNIHSWSDAPFYYTTENTKEKVIENIARYAKYETSWDWLMGVVEKIESLQSGRYQVDVIQEGCQIQDRNRLIINMVAPNLPTETTKIGATYLAVVEFIKTYNKVQNETN